MKYEAWLDFIDRSNTMKSRVTVRYSARGIKTKTGIIQGIFLGGIKIDDKFIPRTMIIDIKESEVINEQA